jgi:1-hydroxycarotenoid 3,4-desaturase
MRGGRVVIVGAGIGGLACAIELARSGFDVTVVERAARAGGKMREIDVGGVSVDSGPTVMTMRWVFDEIFEAAGVSLEQYLALEPLEVLARHAWNRDERLDLFADANRSADAIGAFAGPAEAAGYLAFTADSQRVFETLRDSFLTAQKAGPMGLAGKIGLGRADALLGIRPFDTLWRALGDFFADPRLRQLFGRYATYCGSSPFAAPATLMLIAHVEQAGVWAVAGGMQRLAEALERLATSLGVTFAFGAHVQTITLGQGRADGVILTGGERLAADWVVVNADSAALASGAFGAGVRTAAPAQTVAGRSLSAVTWTTRRETDGFPLVRHNVFFSDDYAAEFDDILRRGRLPARPTIYVCAQDRADDGAEASGAERLLILVNAPANGDKGPLDERDLRACEKQVSAHLARCGLRLGQGLETAQITTPTQFNGLFPASGGALYGPAMHGWAAAFKRPGARMRIPRLYQAGGGAHPGAGVPMAAISGRLAAQQLMLDRASAVRSGRGGMPGGTSTPSATTAGTA